MDLELTTDVNKAVDDLQGLVSATRGCKASRHVDAVIASVRELNEVRLKCHHQLEAETITSSVLRHELSCLPHKLRAEVKAAVESARKSNAQQIEALQSQLNDLSSADARLDRHQEVLQLHNEVLIPEQEHLRDKHRDLVDKLNSFISKKAKMQITLNETCEKLEDVNSRVKCLEGDMASLKEELVQQRSSFAEDKLSLQDLLSDTKGSYKRQAAKNFKRTKELEALQAEVVQSKLNLDQKQQAVEQVRRARDNLLTREADLYTSLDEGSKRSSDLTAACDHVDKASKEMEEELSAHHSQLQGRIQQFNKELGLLAEQNKALSSTRKALGRDLKYAQDMHERHTVSLADIKENVNRAKYTLNFQAQESVRLEADNNELESKLAQMQETHKVSFHLCQEKIAELRQQLAGEQKLRQSVEDSFTGVLKKTASHVSKNQEAVVAVTTKMEESMRHHSDMLSKGAGLQKRIEVSESLVLSLGQDLQATQAQLHSLKAALEEEAGQLEHGVVSLREENESCTQVLEEITPVCHRLEQLSGEKSAQYEDRKKEMIALKNRRAGLQDTIKQLHRELERMHHPQDQLRLDILRCRAYTRRAMQQRERLVEECEKKVAAAKQQLLAVRQENDRIAECYHALQQETDWLQSLHEGGGELEGRLEADLQRCRESLMEQWGCNALIESTHSAEDRLVLRNLSSLHETSDKRLKVVSGVHKLLERELQALSSFLRTTDHN